MAFTTALGFIILIGALTVFVLDVYPIDFVAFAILTLILVLGPILGVEPEEALSGFSNPATITVLAMFVLSAGIYRTGMINLLAQRMVHIAGASYLRQLLLVMVIVGPISAFLNNTAAVAILIPSVITLAREHNRAPSKLLIPLSYFSQLAGTVTLIGTSTNILASALSEKEGYGAFGMFEFAHIGLLVFVTGAIYILFVAPKLLPERRKATEITERYQVTEYLTEVTILGDSPLVDKTLVEGRMREEFDIHVLEILRNGERLPHPLAQNLLETNDILFIKANMDQLLKISHAEGLAIEPETRHHEDIQQTKRQLMEVVIGPNSELIGGTLSTTNFHALYNCTVIAIRKHGSLIQERLGSVNLDFGDTLLLRGAEAAIAQIKREQQFIATEEIQYEEFRRDKIPVALIIIAGVVVIAALGWPILVTAMAGCVLMVLTGCLQVNELHEAIRWDVIFLLAGIIPLGLTLEKTGGADLLANLATLSANYLPPLGVLMIFYVTSMFMAELISHSGAVVVMVPVGFATATALGLDPKAFVLASMFAASMSFSTPVGYQTNTMVYGPGGYKFTDFTKVGLPLNILMAIATPIYIYFFWGLEAP